MVFEEPKAEFVAIDRTLVTVTSDCDDEASSEGAVETCDGPGAPMNNCEGTNWL